MTAPAFRVLVPAPPWPRGTLPLGDGASLAYAVVARRGDVAELTLTGDRLVPSAALDALAAAGMPVLGDARRGGVHVAGELRLAVGDAPPGVGWWPDEPVFADAPRAGRRPPADAGALPRWTISRATARVVRGGHPWLLPDAETGDVDRWRPGTLVLAAARGDRPVGVALVDGPGPIAARLWSRAEGDGRIVSIDGVDARVARALARRAPVVARGSARTERAGRPWTDAIRLVHGEADGLPGIAVDRLGPILRIVATSHAAALELIDPVAQALRRMRSAVVGPVDGIVVVVHLRDAPPGRHACVHWFGGEGVGAADQHLDARGRLRVHERGLVFLVDPGLGEPDRPRPGVGLFLDQRENRERLAQHARRGGRWLNLFAHTGAFSVALLAAGAEEVVSVDLSKPYLDWLEENLAANRAAGVDPERHRSIRRDGRRHLREMAARERFAGIVLDPPTAAAAGRRFWSTRRDLQPLVGEALARLEPGGVLIVSRNQRRAKPGLEALVRAAADARGVPLARVDAADPAADFPRLRGFREGDSFQGVIAVRRPSQR